MCLSSLAWQRPPTAISSQCRPSLLSGPNLLSSRSPSARGCASFQVSNGSHGPVRKDIPCGVEAQLAGLWAFAHVGACARAADPHLRSIRGRVGGVCGICCLAACALQRHVNGLIRREHTGPG